MTTYDILINIILILAILNLSVSIIALCIHFFEDVIISKLVKIFSVLNIIGAIAIFNI